MYKQKLIYDVSADLGPGDWLITISVIILALIGLMFIVDAAVGLPSDVNDYDVFRRNYEDCIQSEMFEQEQCYDLAYATAFGE